MIILDFADSEIRALVLKKKVVTLATTLPLEPGWVKDGVIAEPAALAEQLKQFLTSNQVTETDMMATISGLHAIYRMVNIPRVSSKMLEDAAYIELEKNMPVALDELYTAWQAVNISQNELALCLLGVRREVIDSMVNTLRTAGLRPLVLEPRPLALARLADDPHTIIIDAQPTSFDIVIILGGIPQLMRTVPFSADDTYGRMTEVKDELERTINFYNLSHKEAPITPQSRIPIIVNGELPELAKATGYHCKPPLEPPILLHQPLDLHKYAAAEGLALRALRLDTSSLLRLTMNALPDVYLPKQRPLGQYAFWGFVLMATLAFLWLASLTVAEVRKTQELQSQVKSLEIRANVRRGTEKMLKELQAKIATAQARRDVFKKPIDIAASQRASVIADIRTVTTSITSGTLKLTHITCSDKAAVGADTTPQLEMEITGTATSESAILDYITRLRDSGRFTQVTIKEMKEKSYNEWQFTLSLAQ